MIELILLTLSFGVWISIRYLQDRREQRKRSRPSF
jgi:hypothetical protein